jgi:hypothetical protein
VLQDCRCGEVLVDGVARCPRCGTPNPTYRAPRWRTFWPELDSTGGAEEAIRLGYYAAFATAIVGVVVGLVMVYTLRGSPFGFLDSVAYGLCGVGLLHKWRTAAVVAFLLFATSVGLSLWQGGGIGVLAFFIFVGLLNGVRGTFAYARLSRTQRRESSV